MKRMKRLLSILLVLVFLASLFPAAALAEEPEDPPPVEEPGIEEPAPAEEPEDPEPAEEPEELSPEFLLQPESGSVSEGEEYLVTWALDPIPDRLELVREDPAAADVLDGPLEEAEPALILVRELDPAGTQLALIAPEEETVFRLRAWYGEEALLSQPFTVILAPAGIEALEPIVEPGEEPEPLTPQEGEEPEALPQPGDETQEILASGLLTPAILWSVERSSGTTTLYISRSTLNVSYDAGDLSEGGAAPWYEYRSQIHTVQVGSGITRIGNYWFYGMGAEEFKFADSVYEIGNYAFEGCSGLGKTQNFGELGGILPKNLEKIGAYAFKDCTGLVAAYNFPGTLTSLDVGAFYGCTNLTTAYVPAAVGSVPISCFENCTKLYAVALPEGLTRIWSSAFKNSGLQSLYTPSTMQYVMANACEGCGDLQYAVFNEGLRSIGGSAFQDCAKLKNVELYGPAGMFGFSIGNDAFKNCPKIESVDFHGKLSEWVHLMLPNIGEGNDDLLNAQLNCEPDGMCGENLTWYFNDSDNTLYISGTGEMYTNWGMSNRPWEDHKDAIENVRIGMGCTSIGDFAFYGITIQNLYLPNTLTQIRRYAFNNSLSTDSDLFFEGTKAEYDAIDVDTTCVLQLSWPTKHFEAIDRGKCGDYMNWVFDGEILYISGPNSGVMWDFDTAGEQPWYAYRDEVKKVQFSSGFYGYVGDNAFCGFSALETVDLAAGPHTLGDYAFYGCTNLSSIYLQKDYIQRIGRYCFACCTSLTSVTTSPYMLELGDYAFYGCTSLTGFVCNSGDSSLYIRTLPDHFLEDCTALTHVSIPYITGIGENCFAGCTSLPEVSLPRVKTIGNGAFYNCSALSVIGTPALTAIGDEAFARCTALHTVYFPTTLQTLGEAAFSGSGLNGALSLPDGMTEIAAFAFSDTAITSVTIPTSVLTVREGAFSACHSLADVYYDGAQAMWDRITIEDSNEPLLEAELHLNPSSGELGENISWSLSSDGVLTISGTGSMDDFASAAERPWHTSADAIHTVRVLPGVTTVAKYSFKDLTNLTTVELADSVTAIYDYAFTNCNSLTELELPPRLWCIGNFCFQNCISMTGIQMPDTVTFLGVYAFGYCRSLQTANVSPNLRDSNLTARAFEGCSKLESIDIPEGIQTIGLYAFNGCSRLTVVYLPSSLLPASGDTYTVDHDAFNGCTALTDVWYNGGMTEWKALTIHETGNEPLAAALLHVLPETGSFGEGLTWRYDSDGTLTISGSGPMPNYAEPTQQPWFEYQTIISCVRILDGVTNAGDYAFFGFDRLQTMELAGSVTRIGYRSFAFCPRIESLDLPEGLVSIGLSAFEGCSGFAGRDEVLPSTVTNIGNKAFAGCGFDSIQLPSSLQLLGNAVFEGCPHLMGLTFPAGISTVPQDLCRDCPEFSMVSFPEGVTTIGANAFNGCAAMDWVQFPASLQTVEESAFAGCGTVSMVEYAATEEEWDQVTIGAHNESILHPTKFFIARGQLSTNIRWWVNSNGVLHIRGSGAMPDFAEASAQNWYEYRDIITQIQVSGELNDPAGGITHIGDYAFADLNKVNDTTINNCCTSIGDHAFEKCSGLLSFNCPNSLESIGDKAFYRCTEMLSVNFNGQLADIGERAFDSCRSLTDLSLPASLLYGGVGKSAFSGCESLLSLQIEGLEEIPSGAFYHCDALESVSLPRSLTSVGVGAFSCCDALLDVWYEGRMVEWNQIDIGANNEPLLNANLHCAPNGGVLANGLIWSWQNGVLTISGNAPMPDFANNWETPWYGLEPYTTAIVIEEGVKSVGKSAFVTFTEVTELELPEGLTEIGKYAFDHCSGLESVTLPASLVSVDVAAFGHCTALADVYFRGTPVEWEDMSVAAYNEPLLNATLHYTMEGIPIDEVHFPDANFRACVAEECDANGDLWLTPQELAAVTDISCAERGIASLLGIACFSNLDYLDCSYNQLLDLDLSGNTLLTELDCSCNEGLTALDLSALPDLELLTCSGCRLLTSLDLSHNPALTEVDCRECALTELDLTGLRSLWYLDCGGNQLTELDLSELPALRDLLCNDNQLTELDLSHPALQYIDCWSNALTALDLSNCGALTHVDCSDNGLETLTLGELPLLSKLYCHENDLTRLDLTGCPLVLDAVLTTEGNLNDGTMIYSKDSVEFYVDPDVILSTVHYPMVGFRVSATGVSYNESRRRYWLDGQVRTPVWEEGSVPGVPVLSTDGVSGITVDEDNTQLLQTEPEVGGVYYVRFTISTNDVGRGSVDFSGLNTGNCTMTLPGYETSCVKVTQHVLSGGYDAAVILFKLYKLLPIDDEHFPDPIFRAYVAENFDLDRNGYLTDFECESVREIDVVDKRISSLRGIEYFYEATVLDAESNELTSLDLSHNVCLVSVYLPYNQLTSLDISGLDQLELLDVELNGLTSLDLSTNTALLSLYCSENALTALDVSACTELQKLYCNDNALTELDVSANTALTELFCDANALTELDLSKNTALQMLGVSQCELSALDVSTLPALQRLACYDNPLSSLKLGSLEALRYLSCYDVPNLNTLDISGCPLVIDAYQNGAQTDYSEYGFVHYEINGHILEIAPGQTVATEFIPDHVPGDINGDGSVNNKDVIRLQKYLKDPTTTVDEAALDVNGDGKVNNKDLIRLTRWLKYHDVEIH